MSKEKHKSIVGLIVVILVVVIVLAIIAATLNDKADEPFPQEPAPHEDTLSVQDDNSVQGGDSGQEPTTAGSKGSSKPAKSLIEVVRNARYWSAAYTSWYGKQAPDFTVTDITGKKHALSDYRGKDVFINFWATWCMPCIMEVPDLIELRNEMSDDKLGMLAISSENPRQVQRFASERKLNYTVISQRGGVPKPYSLVRAIPTTFFIDPQGRIKLATEGTLPLADIKAILEAESPH